MIPLVSFFALPILVYIFFCIRRPNVQSFGMLDRRHTAILKEISIFIIVVSHFSNLYSGIVPSFIAASGVALFLLCSGFGLNESWNRSNRDRKYINYWKNKILGVWLPYLVVLAIVVIFNPAYDITHFLRGSIFMENIIPYGWYMQFLFAWYIGYFIAGVLTDWFHCKTVKYLVLGFISLVAFLLPKQLYAEQALSFLLGVVISDFCLHKKTYPRKTVMICGLLLYGFLLILKVFVKEPHVLDTAIWLLAKVVLAVWLLYATFYLQKFSNQAYWVKLGALSYAFYLIHGNFWFLVDWCGTIVGTITYQVAVTLIAITLTISTNRFTLFCNRNLPKKQ